MKFFKKKKIIQNEEAKKNKEDKKKEKIKKKSLKEKILNKPIKLKTDFGIKALRAGIWALIALICIRGVGTFIKADPVKEMKKEQETFKAKLSKDNLLESRAFSFAESFAREYFTIYNNEKEDYIGRLSKYMAKSTAESAELTGYTIVEDVKAYNLERYSDNQVDVYVHGIVQIKTEVAGQEAITDPKQKQYNTKLKDIYIKIPIYYSDNGLMIVEDLPLVVGGPTLPSYKKVDSGIGLSTADYAIQEDIKSSIGQFLKAYYGNDQTQVDYFLVQPGSISAVNNGSEVKEIKSVKAYEIESDQYRAIVEYSIDDSGKITNQKVNINLKYKDDKYLINEMNTRVTNLK